MKFNNISREVTYHLTDDEGREHSYTFADTFDQTNAEQITHIYGTHEREEIEILTNELPFFIEALNLFSNDYLLTKEQSSTNSGILKDYRTNLKTTE